MIDLTDLQKLRGAFTNLPGMDAWMRFAPPGRFPYPDTGQIFTPSAVAVLLFPKDDEVHTLYIQRTRQVQDRHAGQISFPGGKADITDEDLVHTALRELAEETGIVAQRDQLIGPLSSLAIPVSGFEVNPFLFVLNETPQVSLSTCEAERYYSVSLQTLDDESKYKLVDIPRGNMIIKDVPYIDIVPEVPLWGATAMITYELLSWLKRLQ